MGSRDGTEGVRQETFEIVKEEKESLTIGIVLLGSSEGREGKEGREGREDVPGDGPAHRRQNPLNCFRARRGGGGRVVLAYGVVSYGIMEMARAEAQNVKAASLCAVVFGLAFEPCGFGQL